MQSGRGDLLHESIVRHALDVITIVDADGSVRFVNDATRHVFGGDPQQAAGSDSLSYVHPDDQELAKERRAWLLGAPGRTTTTVLRCRGGNGGSWRHVETHGVNLLHDPDVRGLLYVTRDVEERARAEVTLVHALSAQSVVAELGVLALRTEEVEHVVREALERVCSVLAAPYATLLLLDGQGRLQVRRQLGPAALAPGSPWTTEGTQAGEALAERRPTVSEDLVREDRFRTTPDQDVQGVRAGVDVLLEGPDGPLGVLGAHSTAPRPFSPVDVQFLQGVANVLAGALERASRERSAVVRALHDPLTGLPTRSLFVDRLEHALVRVARGSGEVAVLLVDLDRFKHINDAYGHAAGDEVLQELGRRLGGCARESDTVARYGGDEFVVLCEDEVNHVGVARVAAAIRRACAEPVTLSSGLAVMLSCSVGTAWSIETGADAATLLGAADASMYFDKRSGLA